MRAGEADAADALDRADGAQQLGEERASARDVAAVRVDVLPQQRHLADAAAGQQRHLVDDVVRAAG